MTRLTAVGRSRFSFCLWAFLAAGCGKGENPSSPVSQPETAAVAPVPIESFAARKAGFRTALTSHGPSPQGWSEEPTPDGVSVVEYESDGRRLKAWLSVPPAPTEAKSPALVYLHGGFAFAGEDFEVVRPFVDAGYVVLCPMFRGENGNPGEFEMMFGEADDAAAATRWLARNPAIDPSRIYVFGHSSGGVLAALLSLYDDLPIRMTGSSGGLYDFDLFAADRQMLPFDPDAPSEKELRVFLGNIAGMRRPHVAYAGAEDSYMRVEDARREAAAAGAPLEVVELPGSHHSSLPDAVTRFLQVTGREEPQR